MHTLVLLLCCWLTPADPDFALQGEYLGPTKSLQVVALGDGELRLQLYEGGLPGRGWNQQPPQVIEGADADVLADLVESLELKRIDQASPTLGAAPPNGATVLFDGSERSLRDHWQPGARLTAENGLAAGATTTATFQDYRLHLEFRTPWMPAARGQGRGNSGVYHQGRYETQILDSFGEAGLDNECGGLYTLRAPDVNACLPPESWQTYDVQFTAARFDTDGNRISPARITVTLNGIPVHRDFELPSVTPGNLLPESAEPGPIHLQDHGDAVEFRNIWILPFDAAAAAERPRVIGFERFYADLSDPAADRAAAGRILISQLHCTNCHPADSAAADWLVTRPPPAIDKIGSRTRPDWLVRYLTTDHSAKTGSRMPDLWHGRTAEQRSREGLAIASFLLQKSPPPRDPTSTQAAAERGARLFHTVGCVACHAARDGLATPDSTSVPLGELTEKYTLASLSKFLLAPHDVRPSGWMPSLGLTSVEAREIASYLLGELVVRPNEPRFRVAIYDGEWEQLPDFRQLQPREIKEVDDLDVGVAARDHSFALRFETLLTTDSGVYRFHLASDDGGRLSIDDRMVVESDGLHAPAWVDAEVELQPGNHRLVVEYFQAYGGQELSVDVEGPGLGRTPVSDVVSLKPVPTGWLIAPQRSVPPELSADGEQLFVSLGCARCHAGVTELAVGRPTDNQPLAELDPDAGCLNAAVPASAPQYRLTATQRAALRAALVELKQIDHPPSHEEQIQLQLATSNCYACHARDGRGGVERARSDRFITTVPEMGEEGRLPPPLDRAGDKLQPDYLRQLIGGGGKERPYMLTRMPGFGQTIGDALAPTITAADLDPDGGFSTDFDETARLQAAGRSLVGDRGLSCIKCHTLQGKGTPGIQAIDMLAMPRRLRPEWFARYLNDPQRYRPGTRMPASFVDGTSVLPGIYSGEPVRQTAAIWSYLRSGDALRLPVGLEPQLIELIPRDRPILYRNFLAGLGPRGIAVGFPEAIHGAWDADQFSWRRLWRGPFIDASLHWVGRGAGAQQPLGDEVIEFESASPLAILPTLAGHWPEESADQRGGKFLGYRLDPAGIPTFRYQLAGWEIADRLQPERDPDGRPWLRRTWRIEQREPAPVTTDGTPGQLVVRLLAGAPIEQQADGSYRQGPLRMTINGPAAAAVTLIDTDGGPELRLPISAPSTIETELRW